MRSTVNFHPTHQRLFPFLLSFLFSFLFLSCGDAAWATELPKTSPLTKEEQAFAQLSRVGPTEAVQHAAKGFLDVEIALRKLGNSLSTGIGGRSLKARRKRFGRFKDFFEKKQVLDTQALQFIDAVHALPPKDHQTPSACIDTQALCEVVPKIENIGCATRLAMCLAPHFAESVKPDE